MTSEITINTNPFSPKGVIGRWDYFWITLVTGILLFGTAGLLIQAFKDTATFFAIVFLLLGIWTEFCLIKKRILDIMGPSVQNGGLFSGIWAIVCMVVSMFAIVGLIIALVLLFKEGAYTSPDPTDY